MSSVYSSSTRLALRGDSEMLDRMSEEELWTGVDVRMASCVCRVRPLPLFGVLGNTFAVDWLTMAASLPGTAFDSSMA